MEMPSIWCRKRSSRDISEEILIGQVARGLCVRPKLIADLVELAYENVTAQQFSRDLAFRLVLRFGEPVELAFKFIVETYCQGTHH
jgi:hypothetical protein